LGSAGGARRVHDDADVVGVDIRRAVHRRRSRQQRLVLVTVTALRGYLDDVLDIRQLVPDLVDAGFELGTDDQHLRAGVVEYVVHFVGGEPEVDDGVGRTQ